MFSHSFRFTWLGWTKIEYLSITSKQRFSSITFQCSIGILKLSIVHTCQEIDCEDVFKMFFTYACSKFLVILSNLGLSCKQRNYVDFLDVQACHFLFLFNTSNSLTIFSPFNEEFLENILMYFFPLFCLLVNPITVYV